MTPEQNFQMRWREMRRRKQKMMQLENTEKWNKKKDLCEMWMLNKIFCMTIRRHANGCEKVSHKSMEDVISEGFFSFCCIQGLIEMNFNDVFMWTVSSSPNGIVKKFTFLMSNGNWTWNLRNNILNFCQICGYNCMLNRLVLFEWLSSLLSVDGSSKKHLPILRYYLDQPESQSPVMCSVLYFFPNSSQPWTLVNHQNDTY